MYNSSVINRLVTFIGAHNGIADKDKLAEAVKKEFSLIQEGKIYYCDDFSIRFGWNGKNNRKRVANTVLALSKIKNYDHRPLIYCIVTRIENHLLLINTTFLKKVSHSSKTLRVDNIRGSIDCSDIMMEYNSLENAPENFEAMYAYHAGLSFQDNLERLVESTNDIVGRNPRFNVTEEIREQIMEAVPRARSFVTSPEYQDLKEDLDARVSKVQGEIAIAAFIDNNNIRGRIIEYLITDNGSDLKSRIIDALNNKRPLPEFKTEDKLGDYSKEYPCYHTETDIKTKFLFLDGNPKAYNIDKLLEFFAKQKTVYMIYLLGVDGDGHIIARLCSSLDERLLEATYVQHHWAGRNTRGVIQFVGQKLKGIFDSPNGSTIDVEKAYEFIDLLISK
ncbi:MAG: hypothetical protein IKB65_05695 [Ruminiclostridium sp.]|nr:hypothetical protein [Ruminiclostridium sp.]